MSGPLATDDVSAEPDAPVEPPCVEITDSREAMVGSTPVRRALPRRARRTVGAWCFVDHMGPAVAEGPGIGPHPHIGLHTVTWLLSGELVHRDSLGSEQPIRPGQLNVMSAGRGIAHAEETAVQGATHHGVQLWVAQPEATRWSEPAFAHHADLPRVELASGTATVLVGTLPGATSPARADTPLVGVELDLRGAATVPLDPTFEHAVVVMEGALELDGRLLAPGHLGYLGLGRDELALRASEPTRALLIGGTPFEATPLMWWNYVARSWDEVQQAHDDWQAGSGRFGDTGSRLDRIPSLPPKPRA